MAILPEPKSAPPRSGVQKGELEQYGVWVKAEPEDVIEDVALPEESFLSEDEEKLLDSFDSDFEIPLDSSSGESGSLPDIEDMPPLEESLLAPEPFQNNDEADVVDFDEIDIPLRESDSVRPASPIHPGAKIDMDDIEGLGTGHFVEESPLGPVEDVSSDFLEMPGESAAVPTGQTSPVSGSELDDVTSDFIDAGELASHSEATGPSADFETLDIDLQFEDSISPALGERGQAPTSSESGFEAVTEFDDFLSTESVNPPSGDGAPDEIFDDVSAVERDLAAPAHAAAPEEPYSKEAEKSDLSNEILLKIVQELSSIRGELVSLKAQMSGIRDNAGPAAAFEVAVEEGDEESSGGFFDDEEDETIALTGDELDNILNTADFTEEIAPDEGSADLEPDDSIPEMPSLASSDLLEETILPESGDYPPDDSSATISQPAIEEVRLGEADSVDEIGIETLGSEPDDIDFVAEVDFVPLTQAPDDTSYLEDSDAIDLGGGALIGDDTLVEPDLSDFDLGPEDFESRLEIDEELPLASFEPSTDLMAEPQFEDMTLDIEGDPAVPGDESVPMAESVEPIEEIEEPNFADINLHEEESDAQASVEPSEMEELDFFPEADLDVPPATPPQSRQESIDEDDIVLATEEDEEPPAPSSERMPEPPRARPETKSVPVEPSPPAAAAAQTPQVLDDGDRLKSEIKSVLSYLDKLLDSLPEEKIEEFARSEYFDTYKKLFEELGLV